MTLMLAKLPLSPNPVRFGILLSGVRYQLTFVYRDTAIAGGCGWTVDVADTFGAPVLCGVPLITGSNLLGQYQYLDFLGGLLVLTDGFMDGGPVPGFYDLGSSSNVYWVTNQ